VKKKRLLITGGTGLLALNWACALRETWSVTLGTHKHSVNLTGVDSCPLALEDLVCLQAQIDAVAPDLVVHAAGLSSVDKCELVPELAHQANVEIAQNVAIVAARRFSALVHISTDHLFDGSQGMLTEADPPAPVNHYGRTKALAESVIMEAHPTALILRTNFFGWGHVGRQSFSDWLIYNLRAGKELSLFDNVFFTPILADRVALAAHYLVKMDASGVFNLVGDQRLSKFEFARMLADHFSLPQHLILKRTLDDSEFIAARPRDMSLDNRKVREVLGSHLGDVPQFLSALRQQELSGRRIELLQAVNPK
jgi:dTDP-4-dehydrorhamnose reductase